MKTIKTALSHLEWEMKIFLRKIILIKPILQLYVYVYLNGALVQILIKYQPFRIRGRLFWHFEGTNTFLWIQDTCIDRFLWNIVWYLVLTYSTGKICRRRRRTWWRFCVFYAFQTFGVNLQFSFHWKKKTRNRRGQLPSPPTNFPGRVC